MEFYKNAALALDHLDKHQGSVKGSIAAAGIKANPGESKRVLALVIETLKFKEPLQTLLGIVDIPKLEKKTFPNKVPQGAPSSANLILVLLHDLLFSTKKAIQASDKWPPKPAIVKHQTRLRSELVRLQIKAGKSSIHELGKAGGEVGLNIPRYIRWNPNSGHSFDSLVEHLRTKHGFKLVDAPVYPVPKDTFFRDPHLPSELLVFPRETKWWENDPWYKEGRVILQDKSSCFPAAVLMDGWQESEGQCIDATAAPGNKTSYISALMHNKGKLHAFERSAPRFALLENMLRIAHCKNVSARHADFLTTDPKSAEFAGVTRLLLDPSCSGSGIVNRLDYLLENDTDGDEAKAERLDALAQFQLEIVVHALKFPAARRVVYSTCSIHAEEDEQVVSKVLASPTARAGGWKLASRSRVLPTWERRGRPEEMGGNAELADGVIRCIPGEDRTNGFFVSCFERETDADKLRAEKMQKSTVTPAATPAVKSVASQPESNKRDREEVPVEATKSIAMKGTRKGKKRRKH